MDDSTTARDRQGMWAMIKQGYEGLVMTVIRPQRAVYRPEELGPARVLLGDVVTERHDLQLRNPAGYRLEGSWWRPARGDADPRPCIVVLHGNSSCRLGALEIVTFAIPAGFSVFALDFSGSGLSEGKYVSLGHHEREDIATVVAHLRASKRCSHICLWGRSMGAVASLLYAQEDPLISAMVLDSPFSSLPQLAIELVEDGKLRVPKIAVKLVMRLIRRDIKRRAKFDMFKLKPIAKIHKCTIPAFFVVGLQDELVGPHHIEALYKLHNGPNQLYQFPGGHNSPRPLPFFVQALQFLRVMVGLLPLPSELFSAEALSAASPRASPRRRVTSPTTRSVKIYQNPLKPGVSVEAVHKMSVKELKEAIASVGYGDVPCVEKQDLIDLVLKLHARHVRSKRHARQHGKSDAGGADSSPAASPLAAGATKRTNDPSATMARRFSDGGLPVSSVGEPPVSASASTSQAADSSSRVKAVDSSQPFPVDKKKSSSVISDVELSRELSGEGIGPGGRLSSDDEERDPTRGIPRPPATA